MGQGLQLAKLNGRSTRNASPDFEMETELHRQGFKHVAGLDEVGRGCLAGPVAAGAVILPPNPADVLFELVRDSKQLSPIQREKAYDTITKSSVYHAVGWTTPAEIDKIGIAPSVRRAMRRALAKLVPATDHLLIDAISLPSSGLPQKSIIRGDSKSLSIAAASIVAKVERDRLMSSLSDEYQRYGFEAHKGYATRRHLDAIAEFGPCHIHRMSFAPVRRVAYRIRPQTARAIGQRAESFAAAALEERGMTIVNRNFRTRFGEVDLIVSDERTLCFVEVRARKPSGFGAPSETISPAKSRRIIAASQEFLQKSRVVWSDWRIDVAAVELDQWSRPVSVEFIESAVEG